MLVKRDFRLGKPQRPEITRKVVREGPGSYRIAWRVRTYRPVLAHALYVRKVQVGIGVLNFV